MMAGGVKHITEYFTNPITHISEAPITGLMEHGRKQGPCYKQYLEISVLKHGLMRLWNQMIWLVCSSWLRSFLSQLYLSEQADDICESNKLKHHFWTLVPVKSYVRLIMKLLIQYS